MIKMTFGWRGRGCCAVASGGETSPAAAQTRIVMMDRFIKVSPLISAFIVGANEQRWSVLSMLLLARNQDWRKGVHVLLTNHLDLACGTLFATTRQSD